MMGPPISLPLIPVVIGKKVLSISGNIQSHYKLKVDITKPDECHVSQSHLSTDKNSWPC